STIVEQSPDILHDQLDKKIKSLPVSTQQKVKDALSVIVQAMDIEKIDAAPVITINEPIEPSNGS
ncbi:MAG TPA: hypothetical protein P5280_17715, partial [Cyclobacteriaceae bacterium]|nr:hypothetical protein [Cyclobacteriaceae bacterium]